jgi:hypothetical protein
VGLYVVALGLGPRHQFKEPLPAVVRTVLPCEWSASSDAEPLPDNPRLEGAGAGFASFAVGAALAVLVAGVALLLVAAGDLAACTVPAVPPVACAVLPDALPGVPMTLPEALPAPEALPTLPMMPPEALPAVLVTLPEAFPATLPAALVAVPETLPAVLVTAPEALAAALPDVVVAAFLTVPAVCVALASALSATAVTGRVLGEPSESLNVPWELKLPAPRNPPKPPPKFPPIPPPAPPPNRPACAGPASANMVAAVAPAIMCLFFIFVLLLSRRLSTTFTEEYDRATDFLPSIRYFF